MGITPLAPLVACERRVSGEMLDCLPDRVSGEIRQIARLKDFAIEVPERRKEVVRALERYMRRRRGTREPYP